HDLNGADDFLDGTDTKVVGRFKHLGVSWNFSGGSQIKQPPRRSGGWLRVWSYLVRSDQARGSLRRERIAKIPKRKGCSGDHGQWVARETLVVESPFVGWGSPRSWSISRFD